MRAIAEEAFAMVREYKGSHSGEHGDGIVRSEFHETMFGSRIVADFSEVKHRFDPGNVLNPGKIVDPPKMDDRSLFRYPPDYRVGELKTVLDWSAYPGAGGGFQGAVEMCNNNGACRKLEGGVMCPSYRATRNEKDVTRGRANTLRLAISGQLGPDALVVRRDDGDDEALRLLQGLPPRMPDRRRHGQDEDRGAGARAPRRTAFRLRDRLVGYLPHYAGFAARFAPLLNLRNHSPLLRKLLERIRRHQRQARAAGVPPRHVPRRRRGDGPGGRPRGRAVRRYLQPHLRAREPRRRAARAGRRRLSRPYAEAGRRRPTAVLRPHLPLRRPGRSGRAPSSNRLVETYAPFAARGVPIIGLEPSCLLTLARRAAVAALGRRRPRASARTRCCSRSFWCARPRAGRLQLPLGAPARQGAAARPLPPEILWCVQAGRAGAAADP